MKSCEIYDVVDGKIIKAKSIAELSRILNESQGAISNLLKNVCNSLSSRYIKPENKHLIFKIKNIDTGKIFPCIKGITICYHLNIPKETLTGNKVTGLLRGHTKTCNINGDVFALVSYDGPIGIEKEINRSLAKCLGTRVRIAIKKQYGEKAHKTEELIGCSLRELKTHLEKQFKDGMSWDNHGLYGWHMDHIKPCSSFDLTDINEQKKCFHWSNLQPLWWKENLSKGAKFC